VDATAGDEFGSAVAVDAAGERALVGAPGADGQGAAYAVVFDGTRWHVQ
jgi:hypothetical protein